MRERHVHATRAAGDFDLCIKAWASALTRVVPTPSFAGVAATSDFPIPLSDTTSFRGVKVQQAFDSLRADLLSGLSEKHVCEKAAAHPDLAVEAPYGEIDPFGLERFVPSQHVLINAIDEGAIEIKNKGSSRSLHGLPIPSGNISIVASESTPPENADAADSAARRAKCL